MPDEFPIAAVEPRDRFPDQSPSRQRSMRAPLFMLGAALSTATMHGLVRYASAEIHPFEIGFFRSLIPVLLMVPLLARSSPSAWRTTRPMLQAVRGVLGVTGMLTWFYGLSLVPVGDATALNFISVILVTVFAGLFLREKVGVRRWSAVVLGFVGVLIIVRPGFAIIQPGAVIVLISSVFWATTVILVKTLARTDLTITIVFYAALYMAALSLVPAILVWEWPTAHQLAILCLIGGLGTLSHLTMTKALRDADASLVMPIDFTRLVWASMLGYLLFREFPDLWTWIGGTLIAISATYIIIREQRRKRQGLP